MKQIISLFVFAMTLATPALADTGVVIQDYESVSASPVVWTVNVPAKNATVALSTLDPQAGKQCALLKYQFTRGINFQYLGVANKLKIRAPIRRLNYWLRGDNSHCSYGLQFTDAHGQTHQFAGKSPIDFNGWKQVSIDIDSPHETWGGDKNGKIDYPITAVIFTIGQPTDQNKPVAAAGELAFDSVTVDGDRTADEILGGEIQVTSPEYCSDLKGDTTISFNARGFKHVIVKCWRDVHNQSTDSTVVTIDTDPHGNGSFVFPADLYPHGPLTLRLAGVSDVLKDNCYLQLYNTGGSPFQAGIPKDPPPAAKGMSLVFADDFDRPLSISSTDPKAMFYDHKPPHGSQDFSQHPFAGFSSAKNPFKQVDTYLRIRASDKLNSAGLISSMKNDGTGITAKAPCYFECRFIGPNAIGTWPAFWLLSDYMSDHVRGKKVPCDELDIIEAYGGEGPGSPDAFDTYMVTPHCWDQGPTGKATEKKAFDAMHDPIHTNKVGVRGTWFETFHTYGCQVTGTDTIYYCDDIEVGRHATLPLSKNQPFFFLINLATGGGWPVDLSRYHGVVDMYVDYVRVYAGGQK